MNLKNEANRDKKSMEPDRIKQLSREFVPFHIFRELYGVDFPAQKLLGSVRAWVRKLRGNKELESMDGRINRYVFENYLQERNLLPIKLAAFQLGMETDSFKEVIGALVYQGQAEAGFSVVSDQLIDEVVVRRFTDFFKGTVNTLFSDHTSLCNALHSSIKDELGIDVKQLYCETAQELEEPDFAYAVDAITSKPIGIRFQVWLDFGKPKNLRPDACSMYFYSRNKDLLSKYLLFGREPDLPRALKK